MLDDSTQIDTHRWAYIQCTRTSEAVVELAPMCSKKQCSQSQACRITKQQDKWLEFTTCEPSEAQAPSRRKVAQVHHLRTSQSTHSTHKRSTKQPTRLPSRNCIADENVKPHMRNPSSPVIMRKPPVSMSAMPRAREWTAPFADLPGVVTPETSGEGNLSASGVAGNDESSTFEGNLWQASINPAQLTSQNKLTSSGSFVTRVDWRLNLSNTAQLSSHNNLASSGSFAPRDELRRKMRDHLNNSLP